MLVHSIARQTGLAYEKARTEVEKEVAEMRRLLSQQGQLPIGRIGILTCSDELTEFFPSALDSITPLASWRPVIKPVVAIERARDMHRHFEQAVERHLWRRRLATVARAAASIIILLAVCIAVSTPVAVDEADFASLYPEIGRTTMSMPVKQNVPVATETIYTESRTSVADTSKQPLVSIAKDNARIDKLTKATTISVKVGNAGKYEANRRGKIQSAGYKNEARSYAELRLRDSDPYCLIVASLTTAEDAQKFIDDQYRVNPDMALAVLHKDGRYRVYAATGTSKGALQAQAYDSRISRRYKGAWVCAR